MQSDGTLFQMYRRIFHFQAFHRKGFFGVDYVCFQVPQKCSLTVHCQFNVSCERAGLNETFGFLKTSIENWIEW